MENTKVSIRIKEIEKSFGKNKILDKISLEMESGKIYGIVGYNGSGKTVLFKCICGFLKTDAGEIWINQDCMHQTTDLLNNAGIIIEEPSFLEKKSAYQNLKCLYMIRNKVDKKWLYEVLKKVDLNPESAKRVGKYSMGMKQRLAIAQAIMEKPKILILDEPFNGLDKEGVKEMRELFLELKQQGTLMILASHNKDDIDILCDEVYEMEKGKLNKIR